MSESNLTVGRLIFHSKRVIHGQARRSGRSLEYEIWAAMIQRCTNKNNKFFKIYGGRGIAVCRRWRMSFADFIADMGPRPSVKHSLDRFPNNDGNYKPGNCRWATKKEQGRNRKGNVTLTFNGRTQCYAAWSDETGISASTMKRRKKRGWSDEETITTLVCATV